MEGFGSGRVSGMGAFLCSAGTKGRRYALPNARFLMQKTGFEEQVPWALLPDDLYAIW